MAEALGHLRICDLTGQLAGAGATRWLAAFGAEVIRGFGHEGPYGTYRTSGPIVQACCGLTFSSGLPDLPPAGWGFSYMDHHGGNFMALAILMALVHRRRTGEGQWVDMSCAEAGA